MPFNLDIHFFFFTIRGSTQGFVHARQGIIPLSYTPNLFHAILKVRHTGIECHSLPQSSTAASCPLTSDSRQLHYPFIEHMV